MRSARTANAFTEAIVMCSAAAAAHVPWVAFATEHPMIVGGQAPCVGEAEAAGDDQERRSPIQAAAHHLGVAGLGLAMTEDR